MTCDLSIGTCKEDGMFNVVSTCAYGFTQDLSLIETELAKKLQTWRDAGMKIEEIEFEKKNWLLLDAFRLTVPDSFEFIIESVGVFSFKQLITTACGVLKERLSELNNIIESNELSIEPSQNTMANCYDITLENEDYTIGKIIEYMLYTFFYENNKNVKKNKEPSNINTLTYCGFKKFHPHDSHSIIRVAYKTRTNPSIIKGHLQLCIAESIKIYNTIMQYF
jgi:DNA-directed RNA polymerase subunit L